MSPREFESDETLEKYEKSEAEKTGEVHTEEQKEFEKFRKEKKLKKPGAVSRFFNQFGIGKYWERLNDYYEQEEQLEKEEAERETSKEIAGDIKAAAEEKVSAVKEAGAKMPTKILESAARAGASSEEAAPAVTEARAETAAITQEAEAAKTDLGVEIEIIEKRSMEDEIRGEYKNRPVREVDVRIKNLESNIRLEKNSGRRELLEDERDILLEIKKEKMPVKKIGPTIKEKLPEWEEVEEAEAKPVELPPVEEFETEARAVKEERVPRPEEIKPVEVLEEEVEEPIDEEMRKAKVEPIEPKKKIRAVRAVKAEELPPAEEFEEVDRTHEIKKAAEVLKAKDLPPGSEFEEVAREHEVKEEMKKAKVEPVALGKMKKVGKELPPEWEEIEPAKITAADIKKIESGQWAPKISVRLKDNMPDISAIMEESFFFAKGEKSSKARLKRMVNSLEKVRQAYVKQKMAKEISAVEEKELKKWISETKGAVDVLRHAPEMKPVKVTELKKRKAKRRAA